MENRDGGIRRYVVEYNNMHEEWNAYCENLKRHTIIFKKYQTRIDEINRDKIVFSNRKNLSHEEKSETMANICAKIKQLKQDVLDEKNKME